MASVGTLLLSLLFCFLSIDFSFFFFFFFNDTATTEIYTLSLHDALPNSPLGLSHLRARAAPDRGPRDERLAYESCLLVLLLELSRNNRASDHSHRERFHPFHQHTCIEEQYR